MKLVRFFGAVIRPSVLAGVVLSALCVSTGYAQSSSSPPRSPTTSTTPSLASGTPVARGFPANPTVSLRVFVPAGRVRIAVWDRDSIAVNGTMGADGSFFGGGSRSGVKFGVEPFKAGDTRLLQADWLVTIPRKAHVWVKMTDGVIETDGTAGELELYSVGGSIAVRRATGVISVESIDAAVRVDDVKGDLRLRGGKGPLTITNATGTASISSISGTVTMRGTMPECRVETIGGDIALDGAALHGAMAELQTHSGAIRIGAMTQMPVLELSSRTGLVTQPKIAGVAANGRIVARSFKGAITVVR